MKKLYERFCSSIDYKTYKKIEDSLLFSAIGTSLTSSILTFSNVPGYTYVNLLSMLTYLSYLSFSTSSGKFNTKDVNELKNLYHDFIVNYNKLNKVFDLNEPISIYTMFNYLVYEGYLSKNKNFELLNNNYLGFAPIKGIDVINGSGVCRHIASMFTDILNDYGIDSCNVCCQTFNNCLGFLEVKKNKYSLEKNIEILNKYALNEGHKENFLRIINIFYQQGIYLQMKKVREKDKRLVQNIYGNHLITYSLFNDKSYYLDPTQGRILRLNDREKGMLYDDVGRMKIKKTSTYHFNGNVNISNLDILSKNMMILNNYISDDETREIIISTMDICKNNIDIFEKFYSDSSELYDEVSNKLVKIRKK